ncbi:MAG TPA: PspC domain-containing protein [Sphingomicrobium sp.]|nr:PspC domain-containing protein [Sphingomicrobium sp.]
MQDAQPAQFQAPVLEQQPSAEGEQLNLFLRHDTILGVCQGLGEDFGFSPTYLRLAFAGLFYFSPLWVIGTYLALGLAVALSRWLAPAQRPAAVPQLAAQADAPQAANETIARPECLAA